MQTTNLGKKQVALLRQLDEPPKNHQILLGALPNAPSIEEKVIQVDFIEKSQDLAAGQYLAFFLYGECLGSGKIYFTPIQTHLWH